MFDAGQIMKQCYSLQKIYLPASIALHAISRLGQKTMHQGSILPSDKRQPYSTCRARRCNGFTYTRFVPGKVRRRMAGHLLFPDLYPLTI